MIIAPHPDDEAIGCAGAICLHRQRGRSVHVVFLTSGELGLKRLPREEAWRIREEEAVWAAQVLGIGDWSFLRCADWFLTDAIAPAAAKLRSVIEREAPEFLYVPHPAEWHPDHKVALRIVREALGDSSLRIPSLWCYEVWTPLPEHDWVEDITPVMDRKLRAIRCYKSQLSEFRYDEAVLGLNQFRGTLAARSQYAEVFQSAAGPMANECVGPDPNNVLERQQSP
jgi:LmbE family N-acetylglucosaminyl deacetylase